jgi:hypothetical protein
MFTVPAVKRPTCLVLGANDEIYIYAHEYRNVFVFDKKNNFIKHHSFGKVAPGFDNMIMLNNTHILGPNLNENSLYLLDVEKDTFKPLANTHAPHGVALFKQLIYVVAEHYVAIYNTEGKQLDRYGSHGSGDLQFRHPRGIAVNSKGIIVVADSGNDRVQLLQDGQMIHQFGTTGAESGQFHFPMAIRVAGRNDNIIIGDYHNHRLQIFDDVGNFISQIKYGEDVALEHPHNFVVRKNGEVMIADKKKVHTVIVPFLKNDWEIFATRLTSLQNSYKYVDILLLCNIKK